MKTTHFPEKKLLVEGKDDEHVIMHLAIKFNLKENFSIDPCEGIDSFNKMIKKIRPVLNESKLETLGIVVDADQDFQGRWHSLTTRFAQEGINLPHEFDSNGLIVESFVNSKKIKIGIWIMPNNQDKGMIEDFLKMLIDEQNPLLPLAKKSIQEIKEKKLQEWSDVHDAKALIYTWLAWQKDPGKPFGQAVTAKYFKDEVLAKTFTDWLRRLFEA